MGHSATHKKRSLTFRNGPSNSEKGEVKDNGSNPCREWSVMRFTETNKLGSYTTCLSETDNLPRYIRAANDNFNISFEWNPSVTIEAPDMNSPGTAPKIE
jgi:hypothetical protein